MVYYINGRLPNTDGHLFVPDGETPPGIIGEKSFRIVSNGLVSILFLAALLLFFPGKKTLYKEPKLETAIEIEKQAAKDERQFIKSELEQNKADIQIEKESDIKKARGIFYEVKEEKPTNKC